MLHVPLRSLGGVGVWVLLLLLDLWGLWGGPRVGLVLGLGLRGWAWLARCALLEVINWCALRAPQFIGALRRGAHR